MSLPRSHAESLGCRIGLDSGRAFAELAYDPKLLGRPGFIHGGVIAGCLDLVCAAAAEAEATGRQRVERISAATEFLRAAGERSLQAEALLFYRGKRSFIVEATCWQDEPSRPVARTFQRFVLAV